jgi:hypothetical protein
MMGSWERLLKDLCTGGDSALLGASPRPQSEASLELVAHPQAHDLELTEGCIWPPAGVSEVPALGGPSRSGRLLKHGATWEAWGSRKISQNLQLYSISLVL